MASCAAIRIRFYQQLNDFLPSARRGRGFPYEVKGSPAVKDTIEALGVPHPEVDVILVHNKSRPFSYHLREGDDVRVFADGGVLPAQGLKRLKPRQGRRGIRFVLDSHLGKLARGLRLLGFDVYYARNFPDPEIVRVAVTQQRVVLTRDVGLLKNGLLRRGYWVRSDEPRRQLTEVVREFALQERIHPFRRCLECNGRIKRARKKEIEGFLPARTKEYYKVFYRCQGCGKIYWQGAHYAGLLKLIKSVPGRRKQAAGHGKEL